VLIRVFGPMRDEVIKGWIKQHSKKLHNVYSSPNIITMINTRKMRWTGNVACMEAFRKVYKILVGNPEGKRPLGKPRRRWKENIKLDLREIDFGRECNVIKYRVT
jgi:hypothetical protein